MRELPRDADADVIIEISRLLDDHSKVSPVSIMWLIDEIRQNFESALSDDAWNCLPWRWFRRGAFQCSLIGRRRKYGVG